MTLYYVLHHEAPFRAAGSTYEAAVASFEVVKFRDETASLHVRPRRVRDGCGNHGVLAGVKGPSKNSDRWSWKNLFSRPASSRDHWIPVRASLPTTLLPLLPDHPFRRYIGNSAFAD